MEIWQSCGQLFIYKRTVNPPLNMAYLWKVGLWKVGCVWLGGSQFLWPSKLKDKCWKIPIANRKLQVETADEKLTKMGRILIATVDLNNSLVNVSWINDLYKFIITELHWFILCVCIWRYLKMPKLPKPKEQKPAICSYEESYLLSARLIKICPHRCSLASSN